MSKEGERREDIGPGMRLLKIVVVVMGVFIVAATIVLVVLIVRRASAPRPASVAAGPAAASPAEPSRLDEPAGTRIIGMTRVPNGLALALGGGGEPDRVVVIDPANGRVLLRIGISR